MMFTPGARSGRWSYPNTIARGTPSSVAKDTFKERERSFMGKSLVSGKAVICLPTHYADKLRSPRSDFRNQEALDR